MAIVYMPICTYAIDKVGTTKFPKRLQTTFIYQRLLHHIVSRALVQSLRNLVKSRTFALWLSHIRAHFNLFGKVTDMLFAIMYVGTSRAYFENMNIVDGERMCVTLMRHHGVHNYKFRWMKNLKRFRRAGQCSWIKKEISLSPTFVRLNYPVVVKWTVLHEIAHALRPNHGHNKFWKATARELGDDGKRCYGSYVKTKAPSPENA